MKRLVLVLLTLTLALYPLPVLPDPGAITDDLGRVVKIKQPPQRIVSLAPSCTEILFTLNMGEKVVGVSDYCDYPEEAFQKEKVGNFFSLDMEKIACLKPDIVVATGGLQKRYISDIEKRGITVVVLNPKNLQGILRNISLVGEITGKEKEASDLVGRLRVRIDAVTKKTDTLLPEKRPRVFSCGWHEPLWTCGAETFISDIIEKGGGKNITQDLKGWEKIDLVTVVARNPEIIIVSVEHDQSRDLTLQWTRREPALRVTDAFKSNRVYWIDPNFFARPGPRAVMGLEEFARLIHPELFP